MATNIVTRHTHARVTVLSLLVEDAPELEPQYMRPYASTVNDNTVNKLGAAIDSNNGSLSEGVIGLALTDIAAPSAAPELDKFGAPIAAPIANGWMTRRLKFILTVQVEDNMSPVVERYSGYTDYTDPSYTQQLDPKMKFVINAASRVQTTYRNTPMGTVAMTSNTAGTNMLSNMSYQSLTDQNSPDLYRMRPVDMFSYIEQDRIPAELVTHNTVGMLNATPTPSSMNNNIGGHYVHQVIKGLVDGFSVNNGVGTILDHADRNLGGSMYQAAKASVPEYSLNSYQFIQALAKQTCMGLGADTFTIGDLMAMDPMMNDKITYNRTGHVFGSNFSVDGFEYWHNADSTVEFAAQLANSVPSLMQLTSVDTITFSATNRTITRGIEVTVGSVRCPGKTADQMAPYVEAFKRRLITEALIPMTIEGRRDFSIQVSCSLGSEMEVLIALDGDQIHVPYRLPVYCNSLFSPVFCQNDLSAKRLALDLDKIVRDAVLPNVNATKAFVRQEQVTLNNPPNLVGGSWGVVDNFNQPMAGGILSSDY